jgi:RNA polymerase sigma-70 factor (ECF subfamily)
MTTNLNQPTVAPEAEDEMLFCLQSNDQRHFSKLYDRFSPALFGLIQKWIKDKEVAENLLQDVFIKAWRSRELYNAAKGRLFTWLYRITRNICIDHLRSKAHRNSMVAIPEDNLAGIKTSFIENSLLPDTIGLRKLVDVLRREEREVLELMYFKGLTQRQIGEVMDIPLGTVKTRMNKAIKELRYYFKSDWKNAMRIVSLN